MKKTVLSVAFCFATLLMWTSCKDVLNIPLKGSINGYVIDEFTRDSISNVKVTATFIRPDSGEGQEDTKETTTTNKGFFYLDDIWDRARITVEKSGFQTLSFDIDIEEFNDTTFILETRGTPKIAGTYFSLKELSHTEGDSTQISLEIEDRYNETSGEYSAVIFFYDLERDVTVASVEFEETVQSQSFINLRAELSVAAFPIPEEDEIDRIYGYFIEVTDPDGNATQYFNTEADGDIYVSP